MALTPDTVIDAFWQAVNELPPHVLPPPIALRLLAGLCDRLGQVEPSEQFAEEARQCRETLEEYAPLLSGEGVRLAYAYSTTGDGHVLLETFNAEATAGGSPGRWSARPACGCGSTPLKPVGRSRSWGRCFPRNEKRGNAEPGPAPDDGRA